MVLLLFFVGCTNNKNTVQTDSKANENLSKTTNNKGTSAENKNDENNSNSEDKIFIDVNSMDETSTFPFGMSKENLMTKLEELDLEVKNEIEITSREDDPEFGNKQLWADGIAFSFNKNNELYSISVNEEIPTSLDLKKGDSLEKVENLYGKSYNKHRTDIALVYEYSFVDHYFRVFLKTIR